MWTFKWIFKNGIFAVKIYFSFTLFNEGFPKSPTKSTLLAMICSGAERTFMKILDIRQSPPPPQCEYLHRNNAHWIFSLVSRIISHSGSLLREDLVYCMLSDNLGTSLKSEARSLKLWIHEFNWNKDCGLKSVLIVKLSLKSKVQREKGKRIGL